MNKYIIEKPDLSKISESRKEYLTSTWIGLFFSNWYHKYLNEDYYPWGKIKYAILPDWLDNQEELRYIINLFRHWIPTKIKSEDWGYFKMSNPQFLEELKHKIDLELWWDFFWINLTDTEKKLFLQNWITEEAISSSQIEWAMTSSKEAKKMIKEERKPINRDERMIINNYKAMLFIKNDLINQELSFENLFELQKIITEGTLDDVSYEWRLRKDSDKIEVLDWITWKTYHIPPSEKFLNEEIKKLIDYANDKETGFTHPFIKAIIIHFWIGYLHPFCDWNGRTARALFYWYLLKKKYWWFNYIPISQSIKNSKRQYENAYIYSEQDNLDITYFLVYIWQKTNLAFRQFQEYIYEKRKKQRKWLDKLPHDWLNERQRKLVYYFMEKPENFTNVTIHKNYYWISRITASNDLVELEKKGLLMKIKVGIYQNYFPVKDLEDKIIKS